MTLAEFGGLVAGAEKRAKPYTATGVSAWLEERATPSIRTFEAMEKVAKRNKLQRSAVWLAFGVHPSGGARD